MPFKWRLKRTRRYEISSKNSFIVGVYLLDNNFLECTLTSESTGQECLESIAQRSDIVDIHFFGLRYVTKKLQFQWVDLDKPLKKQLDKNAETSHHPPCLYFGIMFYVLGAHKIPDENARYHYYLQLKNDIIDGRIPATVEQAIRLAAYSLQAECGDHDLESQTVEYFRDNYVLLPKSMTKNEVTQLELLVEVINAYSSLQSCHPVKAEIQYIKEVQLMDGYGMEYYNAKDNRGKELYLGSSFTGIFARYLDGQPATFVRWNEIAHLSQNKKMLQIDTSKSSVQYQMEDTDTAKYFCRMAHLQQKFYKSSKSNLNASMTDVSVDNVDADNTYIQDAQHVVPPRVDSQQELTNSQTSLVYVQDQRYTQDAQQTIATEDYYRHSQQSLDQVPDIQQQNIDGEVMINGGMYRVQQPTIPSAQTDPQYASRLAMLPAYRPSPDYESLMKMRTAQQPISNENPQNLSESQIYTHADGGAYSQPEIRQVEQVSDYPSETQYVNASAIRNYSHSIYANVFHEGHNYYGYRSGERASNLAVHPTYSSPELNTPNLPEQFSSDNIITESLTYQYRPPPPYPRTSSSTPDLAVQTGGCSASETPDLLAQPMMPNSLAAQSRLDKSIEDLSEAVPSVKQIENIPSEQDRDDTSSENSYATFHAKETDSESENETERLEQRSGSERSKIQIHLVTPKEAPPPSKLKEVATLRESFRRMMIARSSFLNSSKRKTNVQLTTGLDVTDSKTTTDSGLSKVDEQTAQSNAVSKTSKPSDSASLDLNTVVPVGVMKPPPAYVPQSPEPDVKLYQPASAIIGSDQISIKSGSDSGSIQCLDVSKVSVDPSAVGHQLMDSIDSTDSIHDSQDGSDSDAASVDDATVRRNIGPLKMAAMNGLSLSRPMVLALMNDESRAPKDERRKILESKISEGQVFVEFEEVPKRAPNLDCSVAKMSANESRNRFKDILPYDSSRVKLTPKKDNSTGYINASHVKLSAENSEWWFIATQAPLENTVVDFWQMIWEQEVDVIAMLTAFQEEGKKKCYPYWPSEAGTKECFGDFEIFLEFTDNSLCYVTSRIIVRYIPQNKERVIWHLQYTDWPDHGCPEDVYGFLGFLDEVESVRRLAESEEGSGKKAPVVVHCSAGVGRTGVVILTMVMKWCLEHNHSVDLPKALAGIRQQRMFMVQTLGQYQFIHKTLIQYLKNTRLI
ncbi:tyrosine-protein phosphatase non-receptor type 21-like [Gigantopelta aegis]|uniref:tyrosine-protein phosphatase non-receptor type 21-like n=1 Tax=Gigantopelta aegis TaxID=1735272 RepID=UPI001B88A43B|nr:tyrosine-protein phosphatase non-receptor type 21-like [Gigantopelta aegis]